MKFKPEELKEAEMELLEEGTIVTTPFGTVKAESGDYLMTIVGTGDKYVVPAEEIENQTEEQIGDFKWNMENLAQ